MRLRILFFAFLSCNLVLSDEAKINEEACHRKHSLGCWLRAQIELFPPIHEFLHCEAQSDLFSLGKGIGILHKSQNMFNPVAPVIAVFDPFAVAIVGAPVELRSMMDSQDYAKLWLKKACLQNSLLGCYDLTFHLNSKEEKVLAVKLLRLLCEEAKHIQSCWMGARIAGFLGQKKLERFLASKYKSARRVVRKRKKITIFGYASHRYKKHIDTSWLEE